MIMKHLTAGKRWVARCISVLCMLPAASIQAGPAKDTALVTLPVTEEPLHLVKHNSEQFLIYTNWIEPG